MFDLTKIIRKNILELEPYSSARSEYNGVDGVFLDANENPFGTLNRYPDPSQHKLKKRISELKSIPVANIFIGNGSDEIIDLVFRVFCSPGVDKVLTFTPTYGMYQVAAAINDTGVTEVPLNDSFQINFDALEHVLRIEQPKAIFLCSPNNPTGNCLNGIEQILADFGGIVVVDEAYIDFTDRPSMVKLLDQYPNLIITQTLSKAWGLAGARIGMAFASTEIMSYLNKTKPPYNVSQPDQLAALEVLSDTFRFEACRKLLLEQRSWLTKQLLELPFVLKVYPSDANFLLVATTDANFIYQQLCLRNIIVRNRHKEIANCIRITVGSPQENEQLLQALQQIQTTSFQPIL